MKSISPIKFFTAVSFLLVSLSGFAVDKTVMTKERCESNCKRDTKLSAAESDTCKTEAGTGSGVGDAIRKCLDDKIKSCNNDCDQYDSKSDLSEGKRDCKDATKEYRTASEKASGACDSFEKVASGGSKIKNTCDQRIEQCRKKINSGVGGEPETTETSNNDLMKMMVNTYAQTNYPGVNPTDFSADGAAVGPSCSSYKTKEDRKDAKNDQKERDKEVKALKDKINDENKKITEENAKLREKTADIDIDLAKVEEAVKKAIASVDEETGKRLRQSQDDLAKSAVAIRNLNSTIIKRKEDSESIKFDFAQKMMQFSEDKINTQCQAALDTAKQCFIQSSKGQGTNDPKSTCAGFTISAKGAKGTAQLKAKIGKVRDACFEQASQTVNKAKFEQGKSLRTIETDISEKTNQVNDANTDITRKQEQSTQINEESDKKKTQEQDNADKQTENFKKKLDGITKSTQEAIAHANQKIVELNNQINDLNKKTAEIKMGIAQPEDAMNSLSDAESVISARENARVSAVKACCPNDDEEKLTDKELSSAKISNECKQLIQASTKREDTKGRSSSTNSTGK